MKKNLLSTLVLSSLSLFSLNLSAEDLQTVYQLATQKDPVVQRAAASRDAATARIDRRCGGWFATRPTLDGIGTAFTTSV